MSAANYRPVSLTCICCKMLEHIVLHSMSSRLNDILLPQQHGFRKGLSCTSQLLTATQSIMKKIDQGGCVQAAVLDFFLRLLTRSRIHSWWESLVLLIFRMTYCLGFWIFIKQKAKGCFEWILFKRWSGYIWCASGVSSWTGTVFISY